MLTLIVEGEEYFDEETNTFSTVGDVTLELEHSLVSLSKWESKFQKPFLGNSNKTNAETLSYIEAMIITPDYPSDVFRMFKESTFDEINRYIESPESATTFGTMPATKGKGEIITAELIYYWMVAFNIPFECENWHINRLFALIRICNIKNSKPKKMTRTEAAMRNRELNAQRRAALNTTG